MLAEELPNARFVEAESILEWRASAGPDQRRGARLPGRSCWPAARKAARSRRGHNGGVNLYRDEAIVLRTQKLGEADRIVTFLTRNTGRVRAVGKGVRRTTSKFGSRLEPFMHVDVQFAHGPDARRSSPRPRRSRRSARRSPTTTRRYTAGTAMLETAERLVAEEREPAVQQYLLLVGGLRALAAGERDATLVLDSFLLRSLAVAGYAPTFDACARCGADGPHRSFSAGAGGMLCGDCRLPGSANPSPETVLLLGALLAGDWATAEAVDHRYRKAASGDRRGVPAVAPRAQPALAGPRRALTSAYRSRRCTSSVSCGPCRPRDVRVGRDRRALQLAAGVPPSWCRSTSR